MIKTDKGETEIMGKSLDILADLSIIVHSLKDAFSKDLKEDCVDDVLRHAFEQGLKTKEEVAKELEEEIDKADVSTLVGILKEVLKHE